MAKSLAITGIGAISAAGLTVAALSETLRSGQSHLSCRVDAAFPLAARVPVALIDWDLITGETGPRVAVLAERAAREALIMSGLQTGLQTSDVPRGDIGLSLGSCTGGMHGSEARYLVDGPGPVDEVYREQPVGRTVARLAQRLGIRGPVTAHAEACASTAGAVIEAMNWLRAGIVPAAVVVGSDALTRLTMAGFQSLQIIDPHGCRPFSQERAGMSLGEGAVAVVIEDEAYARRRGARILARLLGWGLAADAHHATAPHPTGQWLGMAIDDALTDAGASPSAVSFVAAHGTGTRDNDACEAHILAQRFGRIPVSSNKRHIGHTMGAAAGFGLVSAVLAVCDQVVLPTAKWEGTPLEEIEVVCETRAAVVETALVTCLAFGGVNAALLVGRA